LPARTESTKIGCMKVARVLMTLVLGLALIGAGLPVRAFMSGSATGRADSTASVAADMLTVSAPDDCPSCDEGPCPLSRADCSAPCAMAAAMTAILEAGAALALRALHDRCDSDCRPAAGRAPPPDPFPPRA
jgi:hypothetical protein